MAHTYCTGSETETGPGLGMGKEVCNPLIPGTVPCDVPSLGVVCTVKGIICKHIVLGPGPISVAM